MSLNGCVTLLNLNDTRGKLWISIGYDHNGFEPGIIEAFWNEIQVVVGQVLLDA